MTDTAPSSAPTAPRANSTDITTLPANSDVNQWTPQQKQMIVAAGLVFTFGWGPREGEVVPAPAAVVEKFLSLARVSGLNPLANQIYCIPRQKGPNDVTWSVQTGIDGFRVIAEEHGQYAGQDPFEWLTEAGQWVQVFIPSKHGAHPLAARATVYRHDWPRPAVAVAEWGAYVQTKKDGTPVAMWQTQGAGQLAKCAEALALRKAFPKKMSGLYTTDELPVGESVAPRTEDWPRLIAAATTREELHDVMDRMNDSGEDTAELQARGLARAAMLQSANPQPRVVPVDESTPAEDVYEADGAPAAPSAPPAAPQAQEEPPAPDDDPARDDEAYALWQEEQAQTGSSGLGR